MNKSRVYEVTKVAGGHPNIFNTVDKTTHRIKRKIISQAISEKAMREFEPQMTTHIDKYMAFIRKSAESSTPVDVSDRFKRFGMDVVGELAFGYQLHLQEDDTHHYYLDALRLGNRHHNVFMQNPELKPFRPRFLLPLILPTLLKTVSLLRQMTEKRMLEDKNIRKDLFHYVANYLGPETEQMGPAEVVSEASFFFPAGSW